MQGSAHRLRYPSFPILTHFGRGRFCYTQLVSQPAALLWVTGILLFGYWALMVLGGMYWLIDVKGSRWWTRPLVAFGVVFVLAMWALVELLYRRQIFIKV